MKRFITLSLLFFLFETAISQEGISATCQTQEGTFTVDVAPGDSFYDWNLAIDGQIAGKVNPLTIQDHLIDAGDFTYTMITFELAVKDKEVETYFLTSLDPKYGSGMFGLLGKEDKFAYEIISLTKWKID